MALVTASAPLMGSAAFSVQHPQTLNRLVDMGRPIPLVAPARLAGPATHSGVGPGPRFTAASIAGAYLGRRLPFPATELGVVWRGDAPPPRIRTSRDGRSWSTWRQVEEDLDLLDERKGTHYSALVDGHRARFVQVAPSEGTLLPRVKVAVINTTDGPRKTVRVNRPAYAATGRPEVISRGAWGADEAMRTAEGRFTRVKRIFVHHTSTPNKDGDPARTLRAIYSYHIRTRGYHDIGYNFLIDGRGRVYEGRFSRAVPDGQSPSGEDLNGLSVLGAHTKDHNAGSLGIALLGNSQSAAPSRAASESLLGMLSWAADRHGINPLGKYSHVDPATGERESLPNIAGHKDSGGSITECPGSVLYSQLPSIRKKVEAMIAASSAQSPPHMPTGTTFDFPSPSPTLMPTAGGDVSRSAVRVDVTFQSTDGGKIRTISTKPEDGIYKLTSDSYGGRPLPAGAYSVRAVAVDAEGRASEAAQVADGYELRPPPPPRLRNIFEAPASRLGGPITKELFKALRTVLQFLGL